MKHGVRLVLGSSSPRRQELLSACGCLFEVVHPDVDEVFDVQRPRWTVEQNAAMKNRWCRERYPDCRVLTADTAVVFEGACITKPAALAEARRFLRSFSGRRQNVLTGVVYTQPGGASQSAVVESSVTFKNLTDAIITDYLDKVDPLDKAGAYDIGQHGDLIIASFEGSRSNIIGLPMETVRAWLAGLPVEADENGGGAA